MWFSSKRPDRPQRRPAHPTVVAYLALAVAVLGIPATAVAASFVVHTRNIADGAVTNPKIHNHAVGNFKLRNRSVGNQKLRNHSVGHLKLRHHAITGVNVRNNSLTGAQIDESTLNVTRTVQRISGGALDVTSADWAHPDPYPLTNNTYVQPAHTRDQLQGTFAVHFPAACTGSRDVFLDLFENGRLVGWGSAGDFGEGTAETVHGALSAGGALQFTPSAQTQTVTAEAVGWCENEAGTVFPRVLSALIHVIRFQ